MDELNLYDDLDEFQEQQEKKSKELQEAEEKYQQSLKTIEELRKENKTLKANIKRMKYGFQSLLDTARSEINRKDKEIERLRKEKDDICFRRKIPVKSINTIENPQLEHNSAVKNPFKYNIRKDKEISTETAIIPTKSPEKDEKPETNKRYRRHDDESNFSNHNKKYRSAREDKDIKYHHSSHDHAKDYPKIKEDDQGGRDRNREKIKESTSKNVHARNRSRERKEYNRSKSRNAYERSSKSSESPDSYRKRSDRSLSREREKFRKKNRDLERNRSRERKNTDNFSKTRSKSPARKNKFHKDSNRDHYKYDNIVRQLHTTATENRNKTCDKDLREGEPITSKDDNIYLNAEKQNKFNSTENAQEQKFKSFDKHNSEIVNVRNANVQFEQEKAYLILEDEQKNISDKDLIKNSNNDIKLEKKTLNSNQSSVTETSQIGTPRKVALFNEIFGSSPSESRTTESTSATCTNSIFNNIKDILAKASQVEIISSATTSPGDYTDTNSCISTPKTINHYQATVQNYEKIHADRDEIDKCFIPIQNTEQNAETTSVCIDLSKVVDDDMANELEYVQIPGLDLCPIRKETIAHVNTSTSIENEEQEKYKNITTGIATKKETLNEQTTAKASSRKNDKIIEIVDIDNYDAVNKKNDNTTNNVSISIDKIIPNNEHAENRNIENKTEFLDEFRSKNNFTQIVRVKESANNSESFNLEVPDHAHLKKSKSILDEVSQKQDTNILKIDPVENILPNEDPKQILKVKDIPENHANDIVIIETFNSGGIVPLKNPYKTHNAPQFDKQNIKNVQDETLNVKKPTPLIESVVNDKTEINKINPKTSLSNETEIDSKSKTKEDVTNKLQADSINSAVDPTLINKSVDYTIEKQTSYTKSISIRTNDDEQTKNKLVDIVNVEFGEVIPSDGLITQGDVEGAHSAKDRETSTDLLQNKSSLNFNLSNTASKAYVIENSLLKLNTTKTLENTNIVQCSKQSVTVQATALNKSENSPKNCHAVEVCKEDDPKIRNNLYNNEKELKGSKLHVKEYSIKTKSVDETSLRSKDDHAVEISVKDANILRGVELELPGSLLNSEKYVKESQPPLKETLLETKSNIQERLKSKDHSEVEANVVRSTELELPNNFNKTEETLNENNSHNKERKSTIEETSNEIIIIENIEISKPDCTNIFSYSKTNDTSFSLRTDLKDVYKSGTADVLQPKDHNSQTNVIPINEENLSSTTALVSSLNLLKKSLTNDHAIEVNEKVEGDIKILEPKMPGNLINSKEDVKKSQPPFKEVSTETKLIGEESVKFPMDDHDVELSENCQNVVKITDPQLSGKLISCEEKIKEIQPTTNEALLESKSNVEERLKSKDDSEVEVSKTDINDPKLPDNFNKDEELNEDLTKIKPIVEESLDKNQIMESMELSKSFLNNDNLQPVPTHLSPSPKKIYTSSLLRILHTTDSKGLFESETSKVLQSKKENHSLFLNRGDSSHLEEDKITNSLELLANKNSALEITDKDLPEEFNINKEEFCKIPEKEGLREEQSKSSRKEKLDKIEENFKMFSQAKVIEIGDEENHSFTSVQAISFDLSGKSPKSNHDLEVNEKDVTDVKITVPEMSNNSKASEEKAKENQALVKEVSVDAKSIVGENLTSKDDSASTAVSEKDSNVRITDPEKPDDLIDSEEKLKESKSSTTEAALETNPIAEKSFDTIQIVKNIEHTKPVFEVSETTAERIITIPEKSYNLLNSEEKVKENQPIFREGSMETKLVTEECLKSSKDNHCVKVSEELVRVLKIQDNLINNEQLKESKSEERLDEIQIEENIKLSKPSSTDDLLKKHELQPAQTIDHNIFSCSKTTDSCTSSDILHSTKESTLKTKNSKENTKSNCEEKANNNDAFKENSKNPDSSCLQAFETKVNSHNEDVQNSQISSAEDSKNINPVPKSDDIAIVKGNKSVAATIIPDSKGQISHQHTVESPTVVNLDSMYKSSTNEANKHTILNTKQVTAIETHIEKNLLEVSTPQGSKNNTKTPVKSCNLATGLEQINKVGTAAVKKKKESSVEVATKLGDMQEQEVVIKTLENSSSKDTQLYLDTNTNKFNDNVTELHLNNSTVTLGNVFEPANREEHYLSENNKLTPKSTYVKTKTNDQPDESICTFKIATEAKDLNKELPIGSPKEIKDQLNDQTRNSTEATSSCINQIDVVVKPTQVSSSEPEKKTANVLEKYSLETSATAFENLSSKVSIITIQSSPNSTKPNHPNTQTQFTNLEGITQSAENFENKIEIQNNVLKEQTKKDESNKSVNILDQSIEVIKNLESSEKESASKFRNEIENTFEKTPDSKDSMSSLKDTLTVTKNKEMEMLQVFNTKDDLTKNVEMSAQLSKNIEEKIIELPATYFDTSPELSNNINNAQEVSKSETEETSRVFEQDNASGIESKKIDNQNDLEKRKETNGSENKHVKILIDSNIPAVVHTSNQLLIPLGGTESLKGETVGQHSETSKELDLFLNCQSFNTSKVNIDNDSFQNTSLNKKVIYDRASTEKDIIIQNKSKQGIKENLSMVPIKVLSSQDSLCLENATVSDEIKNLNQRAGQKKADTNILNNNSIAFVKHSSKPDSQITQSSSVEIPKYYELAPLPVALNMVNTGARVLKKIITKEINIEGEIVEVVKHIVCLNETQQQQTVEALNRSDSCTKDETEIIHNSNADNDNIKTSQSNHGILLAESSNVKQSSITETKTSSNENQYLRRLEIQNHATQGQQSGTFKYKTETNTALEKNVLPTISSSALPDTYNTIPVLPSISTTIPTPSNFSGIFSKKSSAAITTEDELNQSKKKSTPFRKKEYIIPAASVLCNVDNLENATKSNKKLHWELLNNENEMTEIEDDADVDATDEEQIKIKDEPLENATISPRQSRLHKKPATNRTTLKSSSSETDTQTEDESALYDSRQPSEKCNKSKHSKNKININKHKLAPSLKDRLKALGMQSADTLMDNENLLQEPFSSVASLKKQVGRPRKLDNKVEKSNTEIILLHHKKRGRKPKKIIENNERPQPEVPRCIALNSKLDNRKESQEETIENNSTNLKELAALHVKSSYNNVEKPQKLTISTAPLKSDNKYGINEIPDTINSLENTIKILSTSVEKLDICDVPCSSKDSLKQTKSDQIQIEDCAKEDAYNSSNIYHQQGILSNDRNTLMINETNDENDKQLHKKESFDLASKKKLIDKCNISPNSPNKNYEVTISKKQNENIHLKSVTDCVVTDKPDLFMKTDKTSGNNVVTNTTDTLRKDAEVSLENNEAHEERPIGRSDSETDNISSEKHQDSNNKKSFRHKSLTKPLFKKIYKSKSVRNQVTKYISLQDIGIKVRPPKVHLSSFRIPKIKKDADDGIHNSWKLEAYEEVQNEASTEQVNENVHEHEKKERKILPENEPPEEDKKSRHKENQLKKESPAENKTKTNMNLNNTEKEVNEVEQHKSTEISEDKIESSPRNYIIKFDNKTKAGKRKLFSPDMYDESDTREIVENKQYETSIDQSEYLSKTYESNPIKQRRKSLRLSSAVCCEASLSKNSAKPPKKPINVHRRIVDSSCDEDNDDDKNSNKEKLTSNDLSPNTQTTKFESNSETCLKEQTLYIGDRRKSLSAEKVMKTEKNKSDITNETTNDSQFSVEQQSDKLKFTETSSDNQQPLKAIKSIKMRKKSSLKLSSHEQVINKSSTKANIQVSSKKDKHQIKEIRTNQDRRKEKEIESPSNLNKNLKEISDQLVKPLTSIKLRRKSMYVERNSLCNDEYKKSKNLIEEIANDTIFDKNSKQKSKPGTDCSVVSTQQNLITTRRKSLNLSSILSSSDIDKESLKIQNSKNEKKYEDSVHAGTNQQMNKGSDSSIGLIQKHNIIKRRKSTNQRRNLDTSNNDSNSLNYPKDKPYFKELNKSKSKADKKTKELSLEIDEENSQAKSQNQSNKTFRKTIHENIAESICTEQNSKHNEKVDDGGELNKSIEGSKEKPNVAHIGTNNINSENPHFTYSVKTTKENAIKMRRKSTNHRQNFDTSSVDQDGRIDTAKPSTSKPEKVVDNTDNKQRANPDFTCSMVLTQCVEASRVLKNQDIENSTEVTHTLEINNAETRSTLDNSQHFKCDSTTVLTQQKDIKVRRKSTNQSQNIKPSGNDKNSLNKNPEKHTNEQKTLELESIIMDSQQHIEVDSDSSDILSQGKAIKVRRKSTNQPRIADFSSEDDEPLIKKPTVITREVKTPLTTVVKPKQQRKRRVVKVLSTSIESSANEIATSQQSVSQPSPLTSPMLNHPIFNTDVPIQTNAILPMTPNQLEDKKFKEIDSKLNEIFQSPQYAAEYKTSPALAASNIPILQSPQYTEDYKSSQSLAISNVTISPPLNNSQSNVTIDETVDLDRENNQSSLNISQGNKATATLNSTELMLNNSEIKHLSLGSAVYRFEKVSDNVVNLFISRKRKRKRNN